MKFECGKKGYLITKDIIFNEVISPISATIVDVGSDSITVKLGEISTTFISNSTKTRKSSVILDSTNDLNQRPLIDCIVGDTRKLLKDEFCMILEQNFIPHFDNPVSISVAYIYESLHRSSILLLLETSVTRYPILPKNISNFSSKETLINAVHYGVDEKCMICGEHTLENATKEECAVMPKSELTGNPKSFHLQCYDKLKPTLYSIITDRADQFVGSIV